jgi:hypothetical protein
MTNNSQLLNVLCQINVANRNKQLFYFCGTIAVIGVIGFTVYYVKFQDQSKEAKNYREKWLNANQTIYKLQEYATLKATQEKNNQALTTTTEESTIS